MSQCPDPGAEARIGEASDEKHETAEQKLLELVGKLVK